MPHLILLIGFALAFMLLGLLVSCAA